MSKQANPLDSIARWTPPGELVPNPKPDTFSKRAKDKAIKKAARQKLVKQAEKEAGVKAQPTDRKPIGDRQRFRILHRFKHTCVYCGAKAGDELPSGEVVKVHVDHKVSVADGGTNADANLVVACESCNLGKGRRSV